MVITLTSPGILTTERMKKGFSIRSLAKNAGLNSATVWKVERGAVNPNPATARALCSALEVEFDSIFTIKEA